MLPATPPPSSLGAASITPEWIDPSGLIASHRSHTVVAPRPTWNSQDERGVVVTLIVVQSVTVFNTFVNALYFLPGTPTAQLTLYNFQSQSGSQWNLLFMNILIITIPPLIAYIFFNRQIVAGMTSGAVKG